MKREQDLYRHSDVASFLAGLTEKGINFDDMVRQFVDMAFPFSALLVGSLAEGTGNAASDVDIMIIVQDAKALHVSPEYPRVDHGKSFEILTYENGIEFNIKFVLWDDVLSLKVTLEALLEGIGNPAKVSTVPYLPSWELRFLHQLRSGWLLAGTDLVRDWREALMTNLLPPYLAVRHFNEFDESLEDAGAMAEQHPDSAIYAARTAAENALVALLAVSGFTSPSHKWIFHWMDQCGNPDFARIFALGKEILLDDWRGRERELIALTFELGQLVERIITRDTVVSVAITHLRQVISYVPA